MSEQAGHFYDECQALYALLERMPQSRWSEPTQFKAWTTDDIIGHLHIFDHAAGLSLDGGQEVRAFFAEITAGGPKRLNLVDYTRLWLGGCRGRALLLRWFDYSRQLATRFAAEDPSRRMYGGGKEMSLRSSISARQMETWSHGQALFDLLGVERLDPDRLRNVAIIGVNTFGWSFAVRKLPIPSTPPHVKLLAPSGAQWEWNAVEAPNRIEGGAAEFCQVVTQTRESPIPRCASPVRLRASGCQLPSASPGRRTIRQQPVHVTGKRKLTFGA
jgi:uncharacterized protein (TIGR03084 family)